MKKRFILSAVLVPLCAALAGVEASAQEKVTLSLQDCRSMAMGNGVTAKNARLDVLAAQAQKNEALWEYFPKVSATAFGFRSIDPMIEIGVKDIFGNNDFSNNLKNYIDALAPQYGFSPTYSTLQYGYAATLSLMQPVFAGGRIVNGNRLASLGIEAAEYQEQLSARKTSEEVSGCYWQVVALEEQMETLNTLSELLDTLNKDVSSAVAAGLAVSTDRMQVELKRNELKSGMVQLKGGIKLAKMNLLNSIGQQYSLIRDVADSLAPFIDDIVLTDRLEELEAPSKYYVPEEEVAAGLDETRLLELSVEAKQLEKKMALGEALPSVAVGASYGYSHIINGNCNGAVFGLVQIPLSDWGKTSNKVRRLDYQLQKAQNEREWLSAQLLLQIRQLWLNLETAWDKMQVAKESSELAMQTFRTQSGHYEAGLIPMSELMQAQAAVKQSCQAYLESRIEYSKALTEYLGRVRE